jgi:type I restriction enzyme R subunit
MEKRLHALLGERLAESDVLDAPAPEGLRSLVAAMYEVITERVRLASFGGAERHVTKLESLLYERLRATGYRLGGEGRREVKRLASTLAGYAVDHLEEFRAEARRE